MKVKPEYLDKIDNYLNSNPDIIYFELNNWFCGRDYPDAEPFVSWLSNDLQIVFDNEDFVAANKLCVVRTLVDMSVNFCITAKKSWVDENCPNLLTEFNDFLRVPDESGDVYGRWNNHFLEYEDYNIGRLEDRDYDDVPIPDYCEDEDDED